MVNYIKYKGKFWKIVSSRNNKYYLVPKKNESKFKRKFRSYKNISKYGYSKNFRYVIRNQKKRNKLKGGAKVSDVSPSIRGTFVDEFNDNILPLTKNNQYITNDDQKWINDLGNPRDKVIANKALTQLNQINKLIGYFGGNSQNFKTLGAAVEYLKRNKDQVLQRVYEDNANIRSVGEGIGEWFKGLGNKIANLVGIVIGPEHEGDFSQSSLDRAGRALDEVINDLKTKALSSQQTLQQIYLKQGDRDEAKQIRDEEEAKAEKIRKEDREISTPKYQILRNLNPLGYGVSESRIAVDPENKQQVRDVRQNPVLKRIDPNYLPNSSTQASTTNPFQRREQNQTQSSWQ